MQRNGADRLDPREEKPHASGPGEPTLHEARDFYHALSLLVRVYQFRDRQRTCYHDISVTQCYALGALLRRGPSRLESLAAELLLDKSTASRAVNGLEAKGYVRRTPDRLDGRALRIEATRKGAALHARIERELVEGQGRLLARFSPEIRTAATSLLVAAARNAERKFHGESARSAWSVRPADAGDQAALQALLLASDLPIEGLADAWGPLFYVAEAEGRVVGGAGVERFGRHGLLRSVVVEAPLRGTGLGQTLVRACVAGARDAPLADLHLLTTTAASFFARLGFSPVARESAPDAVRRSQEFSSLCPESATVMRLALRADRRSSRAGTTRQHSRA